MSNSKSAGIYSITSKINGKRYIGSSNRTSTRWRGHLCDLRANKHDNVLLQNHYNKYGENDLLFDVVEVIERNNLPLENFRILLLEREQVYLDNWNECQFNVLKNAFSPLGHRQINGKYYCFEKRSQKYKVSFEIDLQKLYFGEFKTEQEAIDLVNYLKELTDDKKLDYHKNVYQINKRGRLGSLNKNSKGYSYSKKLKKWRVRFRLNKKDLHFGWFETEEEAKKIANEARLNLI